MKLKDKNALVTGSSRGIGRAIALRLAKEGANVVVNYSGNEAAADETVKLVEAEGVKSIKIKANVASFDEAKVLVDQSIKELGNIDILVNNAGITRDNLFLRMKQEEWSAVIDTNLTGVFNMVKAINKPMFKQRKGKIVNITSVIGLIGNAGQANYAASKAGVIGLTKSLAKEMAPRNIQVNAVAPGFIETDMTKDLQGEMLDKYLEVIPAKRLGQPEDIASAVSFLASNDADYITGQVLTVDGGMVT
jgi:3-oxoacyl-[acyl-carrier protein] reductase